ncbi:FAD-dependent oxidoreductase [Streptomyces sp. NPDC004980]
MYDREYEEWYRVAIPGPENQTVLEETLDTILAGASMEERAVCKAMLTTDATQEEIAQQLGTTRKSVERRLSKVRQRARKLAAAGTLYLGASAHPSLAPTTQPTAGALRFLLDAALSQLDHRLTGANIVRIHHGNRPLSLDGHPVIGPTPREGLCVASGTHRDGLHASPLIATLLARTSAPGRLPGPLAAFTPCRNLIADITVKEAAAGAADHHAALAAEARMRPPLTGAWPQALTDAYAARMENAYAAMPDGYIPPPDLAPLAYETTGPALAELAIGHMARHDRAQPITPAGDE